MLSRLVSSQGVAALGHSMVKPMDPKYFEKIDTCLSPPVGAFGEGGMPPSMASHMIPATALPRRLWMCVPRFLCKSVMFYSNGFVSCLRNLECPLRTAPDRQCPVSSVHCPLSIPIDNKCRNRLHVSRGSYINESASVPEWCLAFLGSSMMVLFSSSPFNDNMCWSLIVGGLLLQ